MKKLNKKGFGAVEMLLIILLLGLIGGVGWYVWKQRSDKQTSSTTAPTTLNAPTVTKTTEKKAYKVPDGYVVYENKELGFKFVYPKEYGEISKSTPDDSAMALSYSSAEPKPKYDEGVSGKITVNVAKSSSQSINTYKYGPEVKIQDGKLIVASTNPADERNKVGSEFVNLDKSTVGPQTNGDLRIFLLHGNDEDVSTKTYVFLSNEKLIKIELPTYYGGYKPAGEKQNDPQKTNLMRKNILDSIQSLE